jgi:hypothetical protein
MGLMRHSSTADSLDSVSSNTGFHCSGNDIAYSSTGEHSDSVQPPVNTAAVGSGSSGSIGSMHEHSVALALVDTVMRSTTVAS